MFAGSSAEGSPTSPAKNESGEWEREREHGEREAVGARKCLGAMGWARVLVAVLCFCLCTFTNYFQI